MGRSPRPLVTRLHARVRAEEQARRLAEALVLHRGDVRAATRAIGARSFVTGYNVARRFPQIRSLFRSMGRNPRWTPAPVEIPDTRPLLLELLASAIEASGGCLASAKHLLDLSGTVSIHSYLNRYPELWGLVDEVRRRSRLQRWVVRTLGALEDRRMLEQAIANIEGMEIEEVVAEIEASAYAGRVDAQAFAEALVAARDAGE